MNISQLLKAFKKDERGVTAIEYGLIGVAMAGLLAVVLTTADDSLLDGLKKSYESIAADIKGVNDQTY
ncbi:Flp family type IVb pilin [Vibrio cholerae]